MMKLLLILALAVPGLCFSVRFHSPRRPSRPRYYGTRDMMGDIMGTVRQTAQCEMCEMVVQDIQSILSGREGEIQNLLDSLCNDLPQQYAANCTNLVDTYLPLIFTLIDEMTPQEVCELLTMCTGENPMTSVPFRNRYTDQVFSFLRRLSVNNPLLGQYQRRLEENYLCEACEDTVGFVHDSVACNYTWGYVAEFLEPLCQLFPQQRSACENFFNSLPGDVNSFANKYLDPETDCSILGFCAEEEVVIEYIVEDEALDGDRFDVEELDGYPIQAIPLLPASRDNPVGVSEDTVDHIDNMRSKTTIRRKPGFPAKMKKKSKYGRRRGFPVRLRRAFQVVMGGQEEEVNVPYSFSDAVGYNTVPDQKKCEVCLYFSSAAEGVLRYNQQDLKDKIAIVIGDICNVVPASWQVTCRDDIASTVPNVIVQSLLKLFVPSHLCIDLIGICTQRESTTTWPA